MGAKPRRDTGRTLADERGSPALAGFLHALSERKIPFVIIGMSAAVLQGVPVVTHDIDFWIGLPHREHDRVLQICHELDAKFLSDHVVELPGRSLLNFTYAPAGLDSFEKERRRAKKINWLGNKVPVLPIQRIIQSKEKAARPKDKVHLYYLRQALGLKEKGG